MTQTFIPFSTFAQPKILNAFSLVVVFALTACGGGGGGGGNGGGNNSLPAVSSSTPIVSSSAAVSSSASSVDVSSASSISSVTPSSLSSSSSSSAIPLTGDNARRAVLKDIGEQIILPSLRDFDEKAAALKTATEALAAAPNDVTALTTAKAAWNSAMLSWQRNEVLQVGPAGRSTNPDMVSGGQDFRDFIYSWPLTLNACALEDAADKAAAVDSNTATNITGLGALEHLLFSSTSPTSCAAQPNAQKRAVHSQKLAARIATLATSLRNRWEPTGGNFIAQWSEAGLTSTVYMRPQSALNAMSVALFYAEKISKDRKIAYATGLPAAGLSCGNPSSCPEFLESRLARHTGANLRANIQVFKDIFTGVNGKLGVNDLLNGIGRSDLSQEVVTGLDGVLAQLTVIENNQGFDAAVEGIPSRSECVNAFSTLNGLPPCALNGYMKKAMDTFRGPIVAALSLAIPDSAAGDND